jgi:hypothetical protein
MYILPEYGHRSGPKHVSSAQKTLLGTVVLRKTISEYMRNRMQNPTIKKEIRLRIAVEDLLET